MHRKTLTSLKSEMASTSSLLPWASAWKVSVCATSSIVTFSLKSWPSSFTSRSYVTVLSVERCRSQYNFIQDKRTFRNQIYINFQSQITHTQYIYIYRSIRCNPQIIYQPGTVNYQLSSTQIITRFHVKQKQQTSSRDCGVKNKVPKGYSN